MLSNHTENYLHYILQDMAITNIPEMLIPCKMLKLYGSINNIKLELVIDTGANISVIFKDTIERLNIMYLVDQTVQSEFCGIGKETSIGKLWFTELEINNNNFSTSLEVSPNKIPNIDIILGINFLRSNNANIDFKTNTLKLKDINIPFDLD